MTENEQKIIDALKCIKKSICRHHRYCNECDFGIVTITGVDCLLEGEPGMWNIDLISKPKRIHQYGIWYSAESDPPKETGTYIGYSTSFSVTPVFYDAKDNQWETYDGDYLDDMTKWMPLPEPPKGKDNEVDQR